MSDQTTKRIVKLAVTIVIGTIAAVITTHQAMQAEQPADSAATGSAAAGSAAAGTTTVQDVVAVVDGDTIRTVDQMGTEHRVRIIGIDTPEIGRRGAADDCYAQEARTALADLVDGRSVELVTDPHRATSTSTNGSSATSTPTPETSPSSSSSRAPATNTPTAPPTSGRPASGPQKPARASPASSSPGSSHGGVRPRSRYSSRNSRDAASGKHSTRSRANSACAQSASASAEYQAHPYGT